MTPVERGGVAELLKRWEGAVALRVTLQDGTVKALAVPKAGNRWARLQQMLDAVPWVEIVGLDKEQREVAPPVRDEGDGVEEGDEDDDGDADIGAASVPARIIARVVAGTMAECRRLYEVQMRGQAQVVEQLTELVGTLAEATREQLEAQRRVLVAESAAQLSRMRPDDGGGDGGGNAQIMQMIMMMLMSGKTPDVSTAAAAAARAMNQGQGGAT